MTLGTGNDQNLWAAASAPEHSDLEPVERVENNDPGDEIDEDGHFCRLERLVEHRNDFVGLARSFPVSVTKKEPGFPDRVTFEERLSCFLTERYPNIGPLSAEMLDGLWGFAEYIRHQNEAWLALSDARKSPEFKKALSYLRRELALYKRIRRLLGSSCSSDRSPEWTTPFNRLFVGAFDELEHNIEAELRAAIYQLERIAQMKKFGRTDFKSHILLLCIPSLQKLVANTPLSKSRGTTLAAVAFASGFIESNEDSDDQIDVFYAAINARISRAKHSRVRLHASLLLYLSELALPKKQLRISEADKTRVDRSE